MKPVHLKSVFIAAALASASLMVQAQTGGHEPGRCGMDGGPRCAMARAEGARKDPAKMQERHAKRLAELKTQLQITPAQEGAWSAFANAMKPPQPSTDKRPDPAELQKMTTPERMDHLHALHKERVQNRMAAMEQRHQAMKTFYVALDAQQQKTFDAVHARMMGRMQKQRGMHHGHGRG